MILEERYSLANGIKIPKLGLGTWFISNNLAAETVRTAISIGYRHIDTAQAYENEEGVGEGVRTCAVPREQIFVTSKVAAEHKDYDSAARSIDETLKKTGLDYLDMMIIHSPQPWADFRGGNYAEGNREAWRALEDAYEAGKLRAIGVSNFRKEDLDNILTSCRIKPMVNQILLHIGNTDLKLLSFCKSQNILAEAYSPIAHGEALKIKTITDMAKKYGVSSAELCIRYVLELGAVALPKASNPEHIKANATVDFSISKADMEVLTNTAPIKDYGEFTRFPVFSGK